jgi:hypothetical protein
MTDRTNSARELFAASLATARGRLITALTVVVFLLGIVTEVISIATGYYAMIKTRAEAEILTTSNGLSYVPPATECLNGDQPRYGGNGFPDGREPIEREKKEKDEAERSGRTYTPPCPNL